MEYKVSVFTCVYNRAHTIDRVFRSMLQQTYNNIEHIIVDDGSTDELDSLVEQYIACASYPVKYIKKRNGGKHTATNIAWDNAEGDFLFQLDSDDEILPGAIQFLIDEYRKIPDSIKCEYWCVLGRCISQINKKIIGALYPENINSLTVNKAKEIASTISGDKCGIIKRSTLDRLRYPEPECVTFVTESHLWHNLNNRYRTLYTNNPVLLYYTNPEGECLSNPQKTFQTYANYAYNERYELENKESFRINNKNLPRKLFLYVVYYELSTSDYKEKHSIFLSNSFLMNCYLFVLRLPVHMMRKKIINRWHIKEL